MFGKGALEPAKSFLFFAERDVNCRDRMCRNVSLLPFLHELSENIPRLDLPVHPRVGNGKAATREVRCLLGFGVKCDRFGEVPLLAIGGGKIRIQIKVIWIELERPLAFYNCIIQAVVSKVCGGGDVAGDRRYRI